MTITNYTLDPQPIGSLMIGTTPYQTCRIITEPQTWEERRRYARELAAVAGLVIVNDMPEQLPLHGRLGNGASTVRDWIEKCKANTVPNNLSAQQYHWFGQCYARDAMEFYRKQGFRCTADIAAVFELAPVAPVAPVTVNIQHTKYTIDESLTGNARKKAIKQAAKQNKKMKERDDHDGGAGGSGTAT